MTLMPDEKPERYGEGKVNLNSPKKVVCLEHLSARRFYIFPFCTLETWTECNGCFLIFRRKARG